MLNWIKANPFKAALIVAMLDLVLLAGAYSLGRFTTPERVVEVTKTVEVEKVVEKVVVQVVEKKVYVRGEDRDVVREVVVIKHPDGTEESHTTETDRSHIKESSSQETDTISNQETTRDTSITAETVKIIETAKQWHLSLGVGGGARFIGGTTPQLSFALQAERRIFAGFFVGANVTTLVGVNPTAPVPVAPPLTITGSLILGLEF